MATLDGKPRKKEEPEQKAEEDDDKPTTDALISYVKEATKALELCWLENDMIGCISNNFALNTYNANPFIKAEISDENVLSSRVCFACFDPEKCKEKVAAICDGFTFDEGTIDKYSLLVFTSITTLDGIVHNSLSTLELLSDEKSARQIVDGLFFYSGDGKTEPIYIAIHDGIDAFKNLPDVDVRDITAVERDICKHKTTVSFFSFLKSLLLNCDDEIIAELLPTVDAILAKATTFLSARELNKLAITAEKLIKQAEEESRRKAGEEGRLVEERKRAEEARRQEESRRKAEEVNKNIISERVEARDVARGVVVETGLDSHGPVATLVVQHGTLKQDDIIVIGTVVGRVRVMIDDKRSHVKSATPFSRVTISGLSNVPNIGDTFEIVADVAKARKLAEERQAADAARRQENARRLVEEEDRRKAEEERRFVEERRRAKEARHQEEARRQIENEAHRKAEEDAMKKAEAEKILLEEKRVQHRKNNRCQHCGGEFKAFLGIFSKRCKVCKRPKDY